jgi:hypothetical protein
MSVSLGLVMTVSLPAAAAPRDTADWPCQQRLMPTLGGGALWTEPSVESAGDWRTELRVAELVGRIAPRRVTAEEGVDEISAFAISVADDPDRQRLLTLAEHRADLEQRFAFVTQAFENT